MSPIQPHPSLTQIWKNRYPGLVEFSALFNYLHEASLLYDQARDQILLVNSALLKMTAFTIDELAGKPLSVLFNGLDKNQIGPGEEKAFPILRHNRSPLSTVIQSNLFDAENQWLTLSVVPAQKHQSAIMQKQERTYQCLLDLSRIEEEADLEQCFDKTLWIAQSLLETNLICIYQAESDSPRLKKIASIEPTPIFPETIPSVDLIRLSKLTVWAPGRRVLTEIHKAGRVENLNFVVSIPLGEDEALFGLLVAGNRGEIMDEQQVRMLEVLGVRITSAMRRYILIENLIEESKENQKWLAVRNSLSESAAEGVLVLNPSLTIIEINPMAELILGYANVEVQDKGVDNILIGSDVLINSLESACNRIEESDLGILYLHRRNGQSFPARVRVIPVRLEQKVVSVIVFLSDQSENEQIKVQTQQLEHRAILGDFTSVFAHEVRNPINNIVTGVQLLASRLPDEDPNQEMLNRMQADCLRLNHLMESVLSFSRPMNPKMEPVDLKILTQRILDRWRPRLARVNVTPFFQAGEKVPMIMGDARTLEQVFTNLISNAVEAMSNSGGTLAIKIMLNTNVADRPHVEVAISDNGPGIPDDIKNRIFEPFVSNNPRGTGLGLAITKRIVTAHQGSIRLNTFPGGTVFQVYLPAMTGE